MPALARIASRRTADTGAPRATYLTDEQLEHFRRRILAMRREVVDQIAVLHEQLIGESEDAGHDLDRLHHIAEVDLDVLMTLSARDLRLLEALDQALKRIDRKIYGICRTTGRPIPLQRLEALPYTDHCCE